jgi:predicted transcriptional regulator of viral defense system
MRNAANILKEFNTAELAEAVKVQTYKEKRTIRNSLRDFVKRGEFERVSTGRYRYVGLRQPTTLRERLWDIARRMMRFSLDDLEQITEAKRESIREFSSWLVREGYAERVRPGHFKVIKRMGPSTPKDSKKIDRLRGWRAQLKKIETMARELADEIGGQNDD